MHVVNEYNGLCKPNTCATLWVRNQRRCQANAGLLPMPLRAATTR